jgi:hypothetical protein
MHKNVLKKMQTTNVNCRWNNRNIDRIGRVGCIHTRGHDNIVSTHPIDKTRGDEGGENMMGAVEASDTGKALVGNISKIVASTPEFWISTHTPIDRTLGGESGG